MVGKIQTIAMADGNAESTLPLVELFVKVVLYRKSLKNDIDHIFLLILPDHLTQLYWPCLHLCLRFQINSYYGITVFVTELSCN